MRKVGFLKNPFSKWGWRALKKCCGNPVFELKTFYENRVFEPKTSFEWRLEFFVRIVQPCSRYVKGPPNLVLHVSEKSEPRSASDSFYARKGEKMWIFEKSCLKMGLASSQEMLQKTRF